MAQQQWRRSKFERHFVELMRIVVAVAALVLSLCAIGCSLGAGVYYDANGVVYGPFSESQMRKWQEDGYFDRNTPVSFHSDLRPSFPLATLIPAAHGRRPRLRPSVAAAVKYMKKVAKSISLANLGTATSDADHHRQPQRLHGESDKSDHSIVADWADAADKDSSDDISGLPGHAPDSSADSALSITGDSYEHPVVDLGEAEPQDHKEDSLRPSLRSYELPSEHWGLESRRRVWSPSFASPLKILLWPIRAVFRLVRSILVSLLPPTLRMISAELGAIKILAVVSLGILIQLSQLLSIGAAIVSVSAASARFSAPLPPTSPSPSVKLNAFLQRMASQLRCAGASASYWTCGAEMARTVWENAVALGIHSSAARHLRVALIALVVYAVAGHVFTPRFRRSLARFSDEDEWQRDTIAGLACSLSVAAVSAAALGSYSFLSAFVPENFRPVWSLSLTAYAVTLAHGMAQVHLNPSSESKAWKRLVWLLPLYMLGLLTSWVAYRECTFALMQTASPASQAVAMLYGHVAPLWLSVQLLLNEMR